MNLTAISMLLGMVLAGTSLFFLSVPAIARRTMTAFPRNRIAGYILTAIGLVWAARLLFDMPMGRFDQYKPLLYVITPVFFFMIVRFMDELLAARALGGLMLLVPAPVMRAARWHESDFRLVIIVIAYIMAIKGIMLVLSPYLFRKWSECFVRSETACRIIGTVGTVLGVGVMWLSFTVFR